MVISLRDWLKALREQKGITQAQIALTVGISQQMCSFIENGERGPSPETAKAIATELGFDWTRFFEDPQDELKGGSHAESP